MEDMSHINYNNAIEEMRTREYPMLQGKLVTNEYKYQAYFEQAPLT
jgi:hypothetical protein